MANTNRDNNNKRSNDCVGKGTTNFAPDSHKKFCERCYEYNKMCPATGKATKSSSCNV